MSHHRLAVSARVPVRVVVWLVLVVLSAAGCASSHHNPPAPAGGQSSSSAPVGATVTTMHVFAPYDRSGRATAGVVAHRSGSCFTASITVPTASAYRCVAANTLFDPCFVVPHSSRRLDCYADPWSPATRLRVDQPAEGAVGRRRLTGRGGSQLAGGTQCVVTNGTATIVRHVALVYQCRSGLAGLVGSAHARQLRALYRSIDGVVRSVRVTVAWQARLTVPGSRRPGMP